MASVNKQYCFKFRVTNGDSVFDDFFESQYGKYSDAFDELTDHIINIFGSGFEFETLKHIVRHG